MPIKKETIDKLKTTLKGFDVDKLIAAATATDEQDYEIPEVEVLTKVELTSRDENVANKSKKEGELIGEKKGTEISAKAFRKKFNLEDSVGNDIDKVVTAVNETLNKGDAGLKEQVAGLLKDKEELQQKAVHLETAAKAATFDAQLISMFPAGRTQDLKDGERLMLLKAQLDFEHTDAGTVVKDKATGKVIEDPATHAALSVDKVLAQVFDTRKWTGEVVGGEGGRGGAGSGGQGGGGLVGSKKMSEFTSAWEKANPGKNISGTEFDADLQKQMKDVKDFDING